MSEAMVACQATATYRLALGFDYRRLGLDERDRESGVRHQAGYRAYYAVL